VDTVDFNIYTRRISRCLDKNLLENLESEDLNFVLKEKLLVVLKREFGGEYDKSVKVAKLKRVE